MFCLSLEPEHYEFIKKLEYIPVGLGGENFNKNWFTDKSGSSIRIYFSLLVMEKLFRFMFFRYQ